MSKQKKSRLRKCKCCGDNFRADRYNAWHQHFCSKEECQRISHCESGRKYRKKKKNSPDAAEFNKKEGKRVKIWRRENPGYRRRQKAVKNRKKLSVLRDFARGQKIISDEVLRDVLFFQLACFYGLAFKLTGVLRDDIGGVMMNCYDNGKELVSGLEKLSKEGVVCHGSQGNHQHWPAPEAAGRLRLGRSPPGA